jgi:hypothetical protein
VRQRLKVATVDGEGTRTAPPERGEAADRWGQ